LNLIERQNQQIRQYMAPQEKQTTGRNRVVLKKIELLEKILREEDLAKKKNAQSPVMDLFFIQNMIQGSNTMLQSVIQKFMLMKLMETMGKGNQQQMPQYQEKEVTVIAEESAKEDSEEDSDEDSDEMPDMTERVGVTSPENTDMPSPDAG
jgi:hypothetical protein